MRHGIHTTLHTTHGTSRQTRARLQKKRSWLAGFLSPLILVSALGIANAQTLDASPFFQGEVGDFWVYRWNSSQDVTLQIVGVDLIDGVPTSRVRWSGGPFDRLESNSSFDLIFGARLWRSFRPDLFIDGVGFVDQLQEFTPPLVSSLPIITIGEVVSGEGPIVQTLFTDFGTFVQPGTVQTQYRYALIEPVSVPFGTFDAIHRQIQLDLTLEVLPGQFESVRATSRDWLAAGLGSVRIEQDLPDGLNVFELLDTNREFVPEPTTAILRLVALAVLAALARRVRRA